LLFLVIIISLCICHDVQYYTNVATLKYELKCRMGRIFDCCMGGRCQFCWTLLDAISTNRICASLFVVWQNNLTYWRRSASACWLSKMRWSSSR